MFGALVFILIAIFFIFVLFLIIFCLQEILLRISFLPNISVRVRSWIYFFLGLFLPTSCVAGLMYYLYSDMESAAVSDSYDNDQWVGAGAGVLVILFILLTMALVLNLNIWLKLATRQLKALTAKNLQHSQPSPCN